MNHLIKKLRKGDVVIYPNNKDMEQFIGVIDSVEGETCLVEEGNQVFKNNTKRKYPFYWLSNIKNLEVIGRL